jgi:DNA-binding IclR family transcriptional regulator
LVALQEEGLVGRDRSSGRWLLGPELYLLGIAAQPRYDVSRAARPAIRRLATRTGESAFYSARQGFETVCLLQEDGSFPVRSHVLHVGIRFPLGVASAGLVTLAHLPDTEVDAYLASTDLATDYGRDHESRKLKSRIKETRLRGYAINPGLVVEGSWGMAAAVFDKTGAPIGALTLTGIEHRFRSSRQPELGAMLLREAHNLSQEIAASRPH